MTRHEGIGNSGYALEFTTNTKNDILYNYCTSEIEYAPNNGPIEIKVISPSNIPLGHEFIFKLINNKTDWILVNLTTGDTVFSQYSTEIVQEQVILDWGLSVTYKNSINPGDEGTLNNSSNGLIYASEYHESNFHWIDYLRDNEFFFYGTDGFLVDYHNWIRSGDDYRSHKHR